MLSQPKVVLSKNRGYTNKSLGNREFHDLFAPNHVGPHSLLHEADLQEML